MAGLAGDPDPEPVVAAGPALAAAAMTAAVSVEQTGALVGVAVGEAIFGVVGHCA